ncbi:MAG: hypothetical protein R3282_02175, partial [Rhodothermales bacterium]|nr:hypothetical protein [Rhodothermales bacterium]
ERNPQVIYVYLSTGAVYGSTYAEAATKDSRFSVAVNGLSAQDYYPLAKLTAEAKHRTLAELLIADIRIFGYFSRHMKLDGGFFLSELAGCVLSGEVFRTDSRDFVRDYISSDELTSLVLALIEGRGGNGAYDIYSAAPVTKFELLHQLEQNFDLRFELETSDYETMAPLRKPARISEHRAAESIGYVPRRTSSEIVLRELEAMSRVSNRRDSSVA